MAWKVPRRLKHLRLDRRGIPVPYINRWGKVENTDLMSLKYDPNVREQAVFYDDSGEAEPDFTRQNFQRQRECMVRDLCQVCRRSIPKQDRRLVIAPMTVETIEAYGRPHVVIFEPWLDPICADLAVNRCPELIRRTRDEQLTVVPVPTDPVSFVSKGWVEGPLEDRSRQVQPVMWVKILLDRQILLSTTTA